MRGKRGCHAGTWYMEGPACGSPVHGHSPLHAFSSRLKQHTHTYVNVLHIMHQTRIHPQVNILIKYITTNKQEFIIDEHIIYNKHESKWTYIIYFEHEPILILSSSVNLKRVQYTLIRSPNLRHRSIYAYTLGNIHEYKYKYWKMSTKNANLS